MLSYYSTYQRLLVARTLSTRIFQLLIEHALLDLFLFYHKALPISMVYASGNNWRVYPHGYLHPSESQLKRILYKSYLHNKSQCNYRETKRAVCQIASYEYILTIYVTTNSRANVTMPWVGGFAEHHSIGKVTRKLNVNLPCSRSEAPFPRQTSASDIRSQASGPCLATTSHRLLCLVQCDT